MQEAGCRMHDASGLLSEAEMQDLLAFLLALPIEE